VTRSHECTWRGQRRSSTYRMLAVPLELLFLPPAVVPCTVPPPSTSVLRLPLLLLFGDEVAFIARCKAAPAFRIGDLIAFMGEAQRVTLLRRFRRRGRSLAGGLS
jgi:hypothetical protein